MCGNLQSDVKQVFLMFMADFAHTSHMVPGGLNVLAEDLEILRIKHLIQKFQMWYENDVLKCSFDEFCEKYPQSHIAIFYNIAKQTKLLDSGTTGYGFLNYGCIDKSDGSTVVPQGYFDTKLHPLK